jgi:hypothetical protein
MPLHGPGEVEEHACVRVCVCAGQAMFLSVSGVLAAIGLGTVIVLKGDKLQDAVSATVAWCSDPAWHGCTLEWGPGWCACVVWGAAECRRRVVWPCSSWRRPTRSATSSRRA